MKLEWGATLGQYTRSQVLGVFVNRNTYECPCPAVGVPPTQTDEEWLAEHDFWLNRFNHPHARRNAVWVSQYERKQRIVLRAMKRLETA